jgi:O-antigen ligase
MVAYGLALIPMSLALILSGSRGGILSVMCLLPFVVLVVLGQKSSHIESSKWSNVRMIAVRVGLIVLLVTAAITAVVYVGGERLTSKLGSVEAELDRSTADSYVLRSSTWRATLKLIADHPIAGSGFGGYWIAITRYHTSSGEIAPQEAHNDYLELIAGGGLLGLVIAGWFVIEVIKAVRRKLKVGNPHMRCVYIGAMAGMAAVSIHSLVDFGLHIPINAMILMSLIAIVIANPDQPDSVK